MQTSADLFKEIGGDRIRLQEPIRLHTTLQMGGPAEVWAEPKDLKELAQLLRKAYAESVPVTLIGGGANLLVSDEGIPGLVIHLGARSFFGCRRVDQDLIVGAGLALEWLIRQAQQEGLSGVEFLAGVPGRVGGAIRMNAGTHDEAGSTHAMSDILKQVTLVELDGEAKVLRADQLKFSYRQSGLDGAVVVEARLGLKSDDPAKIQQRVASLWAYKRKTQDWTAPSAGCLFKNPSGEHSAGWLIEKSGLKGFRVGGAALSQIHANFMVNLGSGRAADALELIEHVQAQVKRQFQIYLEPEIQILPQPAEEST